MMIESFSIALLCDFVPMMFLLVFHYKNFHKKIVEKAQDRASSEQSYEVVHLQLADKEGCAASSSLPGNPSQEKVYSE